MITLENIKKHGIDFEANPIIKSSINTFGENIGLYLPKITTIGFVIYTAKRMNDLDYKIKSEYLLYGASLYWSLGAFLNLIYIIFLFYFNMDESLLKIYKDMSLLYKENPYKFEEIKKNLINEFINSAPNEYRNNLLEIQENWNRYLENSSKQDRLEISKIFFLNHFYNKFIPTIKEYNQTIEKLSEKIQKLNK